MVTHAQRRAAPLCLAALLVVAFATTAILVAYAHSATAANPGLAGAATHTVTIDGSPNCGRSMLCYSPSTLTVAAGDTVTWVNDTTAAQTVTRCKPSACAGHGPGSGNQSGPSSPTVDPSGGTFTFTFASLGTYNYYSAFHGYAMMHGAITVVATTTTTTAASTSTTVPSRPTGGATPHSSSAASQTVDINANCGTAIFCYSPSSVNVTAGTTVTWVNNTTVQHTVTRCTSTACPVGAGSGSQSGPSSGDINPSGTYSYTFTSPGTYNYYCVIHSYFLMHGTITVSASTTTTTAGSSTTVSSTTIASSSTTVAPTSATTTGAGSSTTTGSSSTSSPTGSTTTTGDLAHTGAAVSPEVTIGLIVCVLGLGLAAASTARRRVNSKRD